MSAPLSKFQQKLKDRREAEAALQPPALVRDAAYDDLVPTEQEAFKRSESDLTIDHLINKLDILDAYDKYIGKPRPAERSGKREGVMISCPMPDHADHNPSAWINLDKQTWYCSQCGGGDKLDLAAIYFGMGDYKHGKQCGELRRAIAGSLGYTVTKVPGGPEAITPIGDLPEPEATPSPSTQPSVLQPAPASIPLTDSALAPAPAPLTPTAPAPAPALATAATPGPTELFGTLLSDEEDDYPTLEWRDLVTEGTFLDHYMQATIIDDLPEEYHFWNGLVAISMAIGRDARLYDAVPVLGNLFLCTVGRTGAGKSRATSYARKLVEAALPYDYSDPLTKGSKPIMSPGSAESMISQFSEVIHDPSNPKAIMGYRAIRGLVDFNELSGLIGRSGRAGSVLRPTLMQFFDGDPLITANSLSNGTQRAENSYASVVTTVQPKAIPDLLSNADVVSGFMNRWIFVTGKSKTRHAIGGVVVKTDNCVRPLQDIHDWANDLVGLVQWSVQGQALFEDLFYKHIEPVRASNDLVSRIDLLCKKLCLLLTANEMEEEVSADTVEKVRVIYEYLLGIFNVQSENLNNTTDKQIQKDIVAYIEKNGNKTADKAVAFSRLRPVLEKKYKLKEIKDNLELLCNMQVIAAYVPPSTNKAGRPPGPKYRMVSGDE